ncbi:hypothetical protein [Streptomyces sp. KL116D]|uniref:hypothetical protein n=1 Tax=Streptomyces sp. KL116D TaxID=3045152 RepID=UPI0035562FCD
MAFHEQRPWIEPQRGSRIHGHIIIGVIITLAVVIIGAIIDSLVVVEVAALAVFTVFVLAVGNWLARRRDRQP